MIKGLHTILEKTKIQCWKKSTIGEFLYPTAIAIDKNDFVYIVGNKNHRIQKFDSNGTFLMTVQNPFGEEPIYTKGCITFDQSGKLITSLMGKNILQRYSTEGKLIDDWNPILKGGFKISTSDKIVTDSEGFLYIVNRS